MARLQNAGTFIGEIVEHGLGETKANKFPQLVVRLRAEKKWVDHPSELTHFGIEAPAWVDWLSDWGDDIVGYLVLFNNKDGSGEYNEANALMNYEQLQTAVGWDGTEFDSLNNDSLVGKKIQFRVEEDTYNDQIRLQVNWVDAPGADPVRELRKIDAEGLKGMAKKLKITKTKPAPAPASAKPSTPAPAPGKPGKPGKPGTPPPVAAPTAPVAKSTPAPAEESDTSALPTAVSKAAAWAFINEHKGGNTDTDIADAWIAACKETAPEKADDKFTEEDWASVRNLIINDLALDV